MTSRYCRICSDFHDLDQPWPDLCYGHFGSSATSSIQIIKDIAPYRAVAIDKVTGKPPTIGSRREHKDFLRRNDYVEMNHSHTGKRPEYESIDSRRDIKNAIDKIRSEGRWK